MHTYSQLIALMFRKRAAPPTYDRNEPSPKEVNEGSFSLPPTGDFVATSRRVAIVRFNLNISGALADAHARFPNGFHTVPPYAWGTVLPSKAARKYAR